MVSQSKWNGQTQGQWLGGNNWAGGTAPSDTDSWLINGAGDTPIEIGGIYEINDNPLIELYGPTAVPPLNTDPDPSLIPVAQSIVSPDIVVNGGSAVVGFSLIDSSIAPSTSLNIMGIAVMDGYYSNLLEGQITVQSTSEGLIDANGNSGELDIVVFPVGSYSPELLRRSYTPNVQNTGTIHVDYGAGLDIGLDGAPPTQNTTGGVDGGYAAFVNSGLIEIDDSSMQVQGAFFSGSGAGYNILDNTGTIMLGPAVPGANANQDLTPNAVSGSAYFDVGIGGDGVIALNGQGGDQAGAQFLGAIDGNTISVNDATAEFFGAATNTYNGSFLFAGNGGTLSLGIGTGTDEAPPFLPISGFSAGDDIVVRQAGTNPMLSWDSVNHVLKIQDILFGSTITQATLILDGSYSAEDFAASSTGSDIVVTDDAVPCFVEGTQIKTPHGFRLVEELRRGDLVVTADNRSVEVKWIGRRTLHDGGSMDLAGNRFLDLRRIWPVRIRAGALGERHPTRDLLVSPDHAILVGDILIQAGALVNGISILQERNVPETFTYYHIELPDHALVLAEGVPAETFVDNVTRMGFDNWHEHEDLYPDAGFIEEMAYPRAQSQRQVPVDVLNRVYDRMHHFFTCTSGKTA